MTAFRPEPQTELMVSAGTVTGRPLLMTVWRAGFWPAPGGEHLAEDKLADLLAGEPGALEQLDHNRGPQIGRRGLGENAAELAHRGAGGGDDDDVFHDVLH